MAPLLPPALLLLVLLLASAPAPSHAGRRHGRRELLSYDASNGSPPDYGGPVISSPDVGSPFSSSPDTGAPDYGGPAISSPNVGSGAGAGAGSGSPFSSSPASGSPDYGGPAVSSPDVGSPFSSSPGSGSPYDGGSPTVGGSPDDGGPAISSPTVGSPFSSSPDLVPPASTPEISSPTVVSPISSPDGSAPFTSSPPATTTSSGRRGSCEFWRRNGSRWPNVLSSVASIARIFGGLTSSIFGKQMTLVQALQNPNGDAYSLLGKQATAALLNAYVFSNGYKFSASEVRQQFNEALGSPEAAASQAAKFERANSKLG